MDKSLDESNLNEAISSISNTESLTKETGADCDDAISSTTPDKFVECSISGAADNVVLVEETLPNTDADFFGDELNISSIPSEKITENVEDIVQDLENLLGESGDSYRLSKDSFAGTSKMDSYSEINSSNMDELNDSLYLEEAKLNEVLTSSAVFTAETKSQEVKSKVDEVSIAAPSEPIEEAVVQVMPEALPEEPDIPQQESTVESSSTENLVNSLIEDRPEEVDLVTSIAAISEPVFHIEALSEPVSSVEASSEPVLSFPESSDDVKITVEQIQESPIDEDLPNSSVSDVPMETDQETVKEEFPCASAAIDSSGRLNVDTSMEVSEVNSTPLNLPDESALESVVSSSDVQNMPKEKPEELLFTSKKEICLSLEETQNLEIEKLPEILSAKSEDLPQHSTELNQPLTVEVEDSELNSKKELKKEEETVVKVMPEVKDESDKLELVDNSETSRAPLIMTIAKHKTNNTHSILKIYDPNEPESNQEQQQIPKLIIKSSSSSSAEAAEPVIPKITIKPIPTPSEHSPKLKSSGSGSPRTSKKSSMKAETSLSPLKLTIKPYPKLEERLNSPKLNIKMTSKPQEDASYSETHHSPKITIKPIIKPEDQEEATIPPFKLNIKPIVKPTDSLSPKITIKPIQKPQELESTSMELIDFEDQIKQERIVLKLPKTTKKDKIPSADLEKLNKIKLKLSREDGLAHIVPVTQGVKRACEEESKQPLKYMKTDSSDLTVSLASNPTPSTSGSSLAPNDVKNEGPQEGKSEFSVTSTKDVKSQEDFADPLAEIPVFEITLQNAASMAPIITAPVIPSTPRKRGRPRKVPLVVREEFKDPKELESVVPVVTTPVPETSDSNRPKRSCRGPSVRATLGIKPRKPRGPSTRGGRGGKRNVSNRNVTKKGKERKPYGSNKKAFTDFMTNSEFKPVPLPGELINRDVTLYEEETRMSADNSSSRAHTPAKQVIGLSSEGIEESQSSIQSNTTTESGEKLQKIKRGPRLEVHQEPEGEVISADKLAEYSWGGGGPYMLQEQVAQFLGIKSFKRKYPGIHRRPVDMQERDFIRESCLASEAMCDMGLTAVKSEDILDIMYTDFQNKYEEYCKHQRDRQAKEVSNKQKALSQEKNKMNIVERAIQSAYKWNSQFNKKRREERKACFDLQTFTIHFPKGKMKQINKAPVGNYPVAVVPGQFTDYYKTFTPAELGRFPINTVSQKKICYLNQDTEESQSDDSGSDSDSSSSDSDSSCSGSSDENTTNVSYPGRKVAVR